jgi:hypothetical protein
VMLFSYRWLPFVCHTTQIIDPSERVAMHGPKLPTASKQVHGTHRPRASQWIKADVRQASA